MERLAGTLQSELRELTQLLTEQEASATAKQEELKVSQFISTPIMCTLLLFRYLPHTYIVGINTLTCVPIF